LAQNPLMFAARSRPERRAALRGCAAYVLRVAGEKSGAEGVDGAGRMS
jgi:hypothetical protein